MRSPASPEHEVLALLERDGPLTGAQLRDAVPAEVFELWRACMLSEGVLVKRVGRRYLRLDHRVEGYARLSPSILREFLTYTVVGSRIDSSSVEDRAAELAAHIAQVTTDKLSLAHRVAEAVASRLPPQDYSGELYCILLAGDVVYGMAHDVARPERSTGQMVRGSDLDLVVVVADDAPQDLVTRLDEGIYQQKYRHLINPSVREEIDYIVKPLARLREQAEFDDFKKMVACKILQEGVLLHGSPRLFGQAKALLEEFGVSERLALLEDSAEQSRELAASHLLALSQDCPAGEDLYLFYTTEESEEFE